LVLCEVIVGHGLRHASVDLLSLAASSDAPMLTSTSSA